MRLYSIDLIGLCLMLVYLYYVYIIIAYIRIAYYVPIFLILFLFY